MKVKRLGRLTLFSQEGIQNTQVDIGHVSEPPRVELGIGHGNEDEVNRIHYGTVLFTVHFVVVRSRESVLPKTAAGDHVDVVGKACNSDGDVARGAKSRRRGDLFSRHLCGLLGQKKFRIQMSVFLQPAQSRVFGPQYL